jgi:thiol-disulfide isomerase/thioredoxin
MKRRLALCILLCALVFSIVAVAANLSPSQLIESVRRMAWAHENDQATALIESSRKTHDTASPEWLAAVSWLARGSSFVKNWDRAEQYATEAYDGSVAALKKRKLDADKHLPTALGAAIEVLSHTYDAQGRRSEAVAFLSEQSETYAGTSIRTRIQKNLNLLSLEGKPMPRLAADDFIGAERLDATALKGKVGLFFFWAHWCGDCKEQKPALEQLHRKYADRGLVIVGPTRLYGYVERGREADAAEELSYIRGRYTQKYPLPSGMATPVNTENFVKFGVSTTPTLVLVDRAGIVRKYHPGQLSYEALAVLIEELLG